jgi:hypothetical protein
MPGVVPAIGPTALLGTEESDGWSEWFQDSCVNAVLARPLRVYGAGWNSHKTGGPGEALTRLLLGDFRGPGAVVEAPLVVAAAWGTAAVSALPFSPCPSPALHGSCERERHEDRHGVGIVPDDFGEPGGWWDGFAVFGHAFDMHGERLSCSLKRLVEAARGGNSAGEIWERDAVIRIGVFVDEGDVVLAHVPVVVGGDVTVIGGGQAAAKPIGAEPALPCRAQSSPQGR